MDDIADAVGRTWVDDRPWEFLSELTGIENRMGGSPGEARAADLVSEAFRDAGLADVRQQSFEMRAWERGDTHLRLDTPQGRSFEAIALPYSPAGNASGDLVDVGHGTPEEIDAADVDGKIAVASTTTPPGSRFLHRMEKFGTAAEAGAEAFVFANHVPGQLPPTGSLTFGEEAPIPAVGVSKETGERLRAHAAGGDGASPGTGAVATAEVSVTAETRPGESQNVLGRVGPETDREVLAVAHYDAHDIAEGALDNGCGIATLVTAARIVAEADLDLGVRFAAVGCEEIGLLGSEHLADSVDLDGIAAVLNVDGAGRFRDLVAMTHTSEATADLVADLRERTRQPVEVTEEPHPFSDQWPFVRRGVPAVQLHSTANAPAAGIGGSGGGDRGRGWGHTHADTLDKVDDRNVREHAILAALALCDLASGERDLPRLDTDDLREAFVDEQFEPGMRAAGMWPDEWE